MKAARRWILGLAAVGCAAVGCAAVAVAGAGTAGATGPAGPIATGDTARSAGCGGVQRFAPAIDATPGRAPLAIGDSVLLGAARAVAARGYEVDVRGCRPMSEGLALLRARAAAGTLPRFVVIVLGTNGPIARAELGAALRIVGRKRLLGLVTPRELGGGWGSDTTAIRAFAHAKPQRTLLIDWVARARGGYTYADGIHLAPAGQAGMANLLAEAIDRAYPLTARWRSARVHYVR